MDIRNMNAAVAASATALTGSMGGLKAGVGISSLARRAASATEAGFMVVSTGGCLGFERWRAYLVGRVDGGPGDRTSGVFGLGITR
jgi:hypothetical protein